MVFFVFVKDSLLMFIGRAALLEGKLLWKAIIRNLYSAGGLMKDNTA